MSVTTHHAEVENKRGTRIRVGQHWADNNPSRDAFRHFTITDIEQTFSYRHTVCHNTHGVTRTTGEKVTIDRIVRIDVDRLHPVRTEYQQVPTGGDSA